VLEEVVTQTKYCCSLRFKRFSSPKFLGWLRHWDTKLHLQHRYRVPVGNTSVF